MVIDYPVKADGPQVPGLRFRQIQVSQGCAIPPRSSKEHVIAIKEFGFPARTRNTPRHDRDTELLRSELFSIEQLKRHAVTLAGQHGIDPRPGPDRLLPRLQDNGAR